jgi:hypothetical protein
MSGNYPEMRDPKDPFEMLIGLVTRFYDKVEIIYDKFEQLNEKYSNMNRSIGILEEEKISQKHFNEVTRAEVNDHSFKHGKIKGASWVIGIIIGVFITAVSTVTVAAYKHLSDDIKTVTSRLQEVSDQFFKHTGSDHKK